MRAKTKEEKEFQGTFEPSKEALEPVQLTAYERVPTAPDYFSLEVQKLWMDTCTELKKTGYLMRVFIPQLESYCYAVQRRNEAIEMLNQQGLVITKMTTNASVQAVNPYLDVLERANKEIVKFGEKYGLTPLDVQKIPAVKKAEGKEMSLFK
jgi:P27 family predicted phage terminase small subunit